MEKGLGSIDILVNNAGISRPQPLSEITEQDWDEILTVNLKSMFLVTQAVLTGMRQRKWGRIINLSSVAAQLGGVIGPHYAASKAGVIGLTHSYAALLAKEGITANAIAPALIETEMITSNPKARPDLVPLGRFGNRGRSRRRGRDARQQRLHHRPDHQREWRLVHDLTRRWQRPWVLASAMTGPRWTWHLPKAALPPQLQSPDRFLMVSPPEHGRLTHDE